MVFKIAKKRAWVINGLLFVISLLTAFGLGEGILRLFFEDKLMLPADERSLLYRYDPRLGWFPHNNSRHTFIGSHTIRVSHNSRGFRDIEHKKSDKPGLLFLGDSFVWGYDVEASERFTDKLRPLLPEWDVYNLGVSGYGTDQELMLLVDQFEYYRPRIVFMIFCTDNDETDNSSNNIGNGLYYKPYFDVTSQGIAFRGVPVPAALSYFSRQHPLVTKSYVVRLIVKVFSPAFVQLPNPTNSIILKLNEFVLGKDGLLIVGLTKPHTELKKVLLEAGIPYLQLDGAERFTGNGLHWTPAGHTAVSNAIYEFLQGYGFSAPAMERRY